MDKGSLDFKLRLKPFETEENQKSFADKTCDHFCKNEQCSVHNLPEAWDR